MTEGAEGALPAGRRLVPDAPAPPRRPGDPRAEGLRAGYARVFGSCPVPVPVEAIAEDYLGLTLRSAPMPVSGLLVVPRREVWTHDAEPMARRRFTIAHEIAHWVCHRADAPASCDLDSREADRDPREREANTFAAELLMPAGAVRAAHANRADAGLLAARFHVSVEAMAWRLFNLALGPPPA